MDVKGNYLRYSTWKGTKVQQADPGEELTGKVDEDLLDGTLPDAVTFVVAEHLRENLRKILAVSTRDGDVVTEAEETTELATKEEPAEDVVFMSCCFSFHFFLVFNIVVFNLILLYCCNLTVTSLTTDCV